MENQDKKKILIIYYEMMLGGSTTSLLSFLNCLDKTKYDIDLQLYRNRGELFDFIPSHVNLLPQAFKYSGKIGSILKKIKFVLTGYCFKALRVNKKYGYKGFSEQTMCDFCAKHLSRKNKKHYDYAIGFIEGWSDRYLVEKVCADKKYAWIHSTFKNIAKIPELEYQWISKVDKLIFVAEDCKKDFLTMASQFTDKTIVVENIFDDEIVKKRSLVNETENDYQIFLEDKSFKFITVCRLHVQTKGLDRIVNCVKTLKDKGYEFSWYIIGDGEDRVLIEKLIEENGIEDKMFLLGLKTNPYPFIKDADVMCMPSRWEGKPMVVTESKILGTPVVVTEYLSAREQVKDGVEGVIVENNDEAIISAIIDLLNNIEKVNKMKAYLLEHKYGNSEYIEEIERELF